MSIVAGRQPHPSNTVQSMHAMTQPWPAVTAGMPLGAMAQAPSDRPVEIRAVALAVWRRRWIMVLCLLLSIGAGIFLLKHMQPTYTAQAEIMLNNRETRVVDIESVVSDLGSTDDADNEQRVLTSQMLLQRVIDRLRLDRDPEFNPGLRPPGLMQRWQADFIAAFPGSPIAEALVPEPVSDDPMLRTERARLAVIETVRAAITVEGVDRTRALTIGVSSGDPAKSALIANTLADLYIVGQLEEKFEATRRASAWLSARIGDLKRKVHTSEAAVEAFKAKQSLGEGQGTELTDLQVAELNTELITARAARAEAEARAGQVQQRLKRGGIEAAASVVSSVLVVDLRKELAELQRNEAELSSRYGDRHPRMLDLRAKIADARDGIALEVRKIIEGLRNDAAVALAREKALRRSLSELEDKSVALSRASVQLRQLEREAEADLLIYQNFLNRFRETTEQEDLQAADARILSLATPPLARSSPQTKKVLAISTVLGLALGFGLVALLERLDRTYRSAAAIETATGLPVLTALPRRRTRSTRGLLDHIIKRPDGGLAEAVRSLRTALAMAPGVGPDGAAPKVIMLTSALPGEGKSTTALLLAQMAAQADRRVLVIDCDLRRPSVQRTFGLGRRPGLSAVLDGALTLQDAVIQDQATGLDMLMATQGEPSAAERLCSPAFDHLLGEARARYDLIVLDAPPILAVSDAAIVGRLADRILYAVQWAETQRGAVGQGLARLSGFGLSVTGVVLTMVNPTREALYAAEDGGFGYDAGTSAYARG